MHKKHFLSALKTLAFSALLSISFTSAAQVDTYEAGERGFLRSPMEAADGSFVLTNNRFTEIYALRDGKLTTLVSGRGSGIYTKMSKDKAYVGFKTFDENEFQAPAIVEVATGKVTVLEDFCHQCGQVSFSDDGTMAYTMGNNLVIRKGDNRKVYDLGFYTNIANISPDATKVAYSHIDGQMFIINLANGEVEEFNIAGGYDAVWSPDGSKLAVHTVNGTLSVADRNTNKIYNFGNAVSASWANNSNELVYTVVERSNDLAVTGSSIKHANFDATNVRTLVASSADMPTDAILTSKNQLIIPYSTGNKRGLSMRTLPSTGITPKSITSTEETTLFSIKSEVFGARFDDPCDSRKPLKKIKPLAFEQKIGANDIPYLSQIYDVPSVNGCTSWGYSACAPTAACMYLGYYGLIDKKASTSRYDSSVKYYAYAIGEVFTNQAGTYTFNLTSYKKCAYIPGGYGYMWNTASPQSHIEDFLKLNGCTSTTKTYVGTTAWSTFKSECSEGRPYLICVNLGSSGHVILGFATNCKYRSASGFIEQTGSFVCHDPYGDYNDSSWPDGDGQHSSYDWVGYNNGLGNIGTYHWSVKAIPGSPTAPAPDPITASPTSVKLEGVFGSTETIYKDVTIVGTGLTNPMSVNSVNSTVIVSKLDGWDDYKGGTLRLTLNTNYSLGAGNYKGYVAVKSGSEGIQIGTQVKLTEPSAIDEIKAEDTPAEYYNLQGVRVESPKKGIYIKQQGNKSIKVIL